MIILWARGHTSHVTASLMERRKALTDIQDFLGYARVNRNLMEYHSYYEDLEDGYVQKRMAKALGIEE